MAYPDAKFHLDTTSFDEVITKEKGTNFWPTLSHTGIITGTFITFKIIVKQNLYSLAEIMHIIVAFYNM